MSVTPRARALACAIAFAATTVSAATASPPEQIVYTLTVPIGTHDFDRNLTAPPAGYPTVHVAVACAIGSHLHFKNSNISGNVVAEATNTGTSTGTTLGNVTVTIVVAPRSYARLVKVQRPAYLCSFVAGQIRDLSDVVITPRNVTGSVAGDVPVPRM